MLTQMSGERIAFYSAVEGGAPFLRAVDVAEARLERVARIVQTGEQGGKEEGEEKLGGLRERVQTEVAALRSELIAPALRFRKAFRKALSRFKKSKREWVMLTEGEEEVAALVRWRVFTHTHTCPPRRLLARAHTGHVVMDNLLLCPVCGAGGGSHYLPDRKPVTTDDLGLLPSIRGDGRGKKKNSKTQAKEERRRKRQRRSRSNSRVGRGGGGGDGDVGFERSRSQP